MCSWNDGWRVSLKDRLWMCYLIQGNWLNIQGSHPTCGFVIFCYPYRNLILSTCWVEKIRGIGVEGLSLTWNIERGFSPCTFCECWYVKVGPVFSQICIWNVIVRAEYDGEGFWIALLVNWKTTGIYDVSCWLCNVDGYQTPICVAAVPSPSQRQCEFFHNLKPISSINLMMAHSWSTQLVNLPLNIV